MKDQKAIISNRIYLRPLSEEHRKEIINSLTYKIENKKAGLVKQLEVIKNYKVLPNGILSIPQGRTDLLKDQYDLEDKRVFNPVSFSEPQFDLREDQEVVYKDVSDTCFINAQVGWGKTFTALWIAKKLGQKTLVVTHNTMLKDQWIEEATKLYGVVPGIITRGIFDIENKSIVVGNIQTLIKHIPKISKEFGTVILDEAHHVPADTFSNLIDCMYSRYRIGLSGTIGRTDGKEVVFTDYFGHKMYKPPQSNTINPVVKLFHTGVRLDSSGTWVEKVNKLLYDPDYQQLIAGLAVSEILNGHSILIVADRKEFLANVKEYIGDDCVLITGETNYETRRKIESQINDQEKSCIAGSRGIFSEGISINRLSCVIIATPTANEINLEQIIGRVMRKYPGKLNPVVIDIAFSSPAEKRQLSKRLGFYASKGWVVETYKA